ncbi:hypothetical protein [Streptomyces canus]
MTTDRAAVDIAGDHILSNKIIPGLVPLREKSPLNLRAFHG